MGWDGKGDERSGKREREKIIMLREKKNVRGDFFFDFFHLFFVFVFVCKASQIEVKVIRNS